MHRYRSQYMQQEERDNAKLKRIYEIPLDEVDPCPDHPFYVRDDEDMMNLVEKEQEMTAASRKTAIPKTKMQELTPSQLQDFIETMPEGTVASIDMKGLVLSDG